MYHLKVEVMDDQRRLPNNIDFSTPVEQTSTTTSSSSSSSSTSARDGLRRSGEESHGEEDVLRVSVGNPFIEVIKGTIHIYKHSTNRSVARRGQLPPQITLLVAVLAVPSWMTVADFCQFVTPYHRLILHMRVVAHLEKIPGRYGVLLEFRQQTMAEQFYLEYNGKKFNSMELEECRVGFVKLVEFLDGSYMGAIMPPPGTNELPTCPVCLDRLDASVTGVLTMLCNHTFHCMCLSKWRDSTCPVCRYCQDSVHTSECSVCGQSESLWICLICGHIGCGRYTGGHANNHWMETQHTYALELETQRVWDYAGDNYVHRLIQSKTDGKLVEVPGPETDVVDPEMKEGILESKRMAVAMEYTFLLSSQLESQRQYWEHQLQIVENEKNEKIHQLEHELKKEKQEKEFLFASLNDLQHNRDKSQKKITQLEKKINQYQREMKELKQTNEGIALSQAEWRDQAKATEEKLRTYSNTTEKRIKELEEQVSDLMFFIDAKNKIEGADEELKDGSLLITESPQKPSPTRRGARGKKKGK